MARTSMFLMISALFLLISACAQKEKPAETKIAPGANFETGKKAIQQMAGCYLVDYSYVETDGLKPGYKRDNRVYDVNKTKAVKEWIYAEQTGPTRLRLQHLLFAVDEKGQLQESSLLKHQAEDWEYSAPFVYEFVQPSYWVANSLPKDNDLWTRKVTNLDDGLRYQCAAPWTHDGAYPEWKCENYAPIPGRETRDMGRKDYQTLNRITRVIVYGDSWLERQDNTKTIHQGQKQTPLAKEVGKNWYVRLPESECKVMKDYAASRKNFWNLLRQTWDDVLVGDKPFVEKKIDSQPPRFAKMMAIEKKYLQQDLNKPEIRQQAREEILNTIAEYRTDEASLQTPAKGTKQ